MPEIYEKLNADLLISTIGVKSYFPSDLPKGFNVKYFEYDDTEYPYNQLFGKFVSNLSILDLILNCGKDAKKIILKNTNYDF